MEILGKIFTNIEDELSLFSKAEIQNVSERLYLKSNPVGGGANR